MDKGNTVEVEHDDKRDETLKQLFDAVKKNDISSIQKFLEKTTKHEVTFCIVCLMCPRPLFVSFVLGCCLFTLNI